MIFPPAFLDSSSWNDNQHAQHPSNISTLIAAGGSGGGDGGNHELLQPAITAGTLSEGGGAPVGPAKPMSMAERARLARIPLPEPGLKCPRCESTNTKFCYFNNYSLSQPRHFCRACRRYWTRGGALRNVPVGGGYRRHAKRTKPKASAAAAVSATPGATSAPASTSTCSTVMSAPALPGMLSSSTSILPPLLRISDFDAMSLGSSFTGVGKPLIDMADAYSICGGVSGGSHAAGLEQWRVQQMQSFPFFHAMNQAAPPPAMAMPGMLHLGIDISGGAGSGEDGGEFHVMPMKREGNARGMYGDHLSGYSSYSSSTTGNLL